MQQIRKKQQDIFKVEKMNELAMLAKNSSRNLLTTSWSQSKMCFGNTLNAFKNTANEEQIYQKESQNKGKF